MRKPAKITNHIRPPLTHPKGQYIYAYHNIRTHQVLYSLTRDLDPIHSSKQLPDTGANTYPSTALRKDLWHPLYTLHLPSGAAQESSAGQASNLQGLHAYKKLREWRKLHEHNWQPPEWFSKPYSEEKREALQKRLDERGGSKKESVYDLIKREKRRERVRGVLDQKANSIADLAAVLAEQDELGGVREKVREETRGERRWREVREMVSLVKEAENGGREKLEERMGYLRSFVAAEEEDEIVREARASGLSKRHAGRELNELSTKKQKTTFALQAMAHAQPEARRTQLTSLRHSDNAKFVEHLTALDENTAKLPQRIQDLHQALKHIRHEARLPTNLAHIQTKTEGLSNDAAISTILAELRTSSGAIGASLAREDALRAAVTALQNGKEITDTEIRAMVQGSSPEAAIAKLEQEIEQEMAKCRHEVRESRVEDIRSAIMLAREGQGIEIADKELRGYDVYGLERRFIRVEAERDEISAARKAGGGGVEATIARIQEMENEVQALENSRQEEIVDDESSGGGGDRDKIELLRARIGIARQLVAGVEMPAYAKELHEIREEGITVLRSRAAKQEAQNRKTLAASEESARRKVADMQAAIEKARQGETIAQKVYAKAVKGLGMEKGIERLELDQQWEETFLEEAKDVKERSVEAARTRLERLREEVTVLEARGEELTKEDKRKIGLLGVRSSANYELIKHIERFEEMQQQDLTDVEAITDTPLTTSDYLLLLPSYPEDLQIPTEQSKDAATKHRFTQKRLNIPVFTTQGAKVSWSNILDAEYADSWPENVEHEAMGFAKHRAPDPKAEPVMTAEQWGQREGERVRSKHDGKRGVVSDAVRERVGEMIEKVKQGLPDPRTLAGLPLVQAGVKREVRERDVLREMERGQDIALDYEERRRVAEEALLGRKREEGEAWAAAKLERRERYQIGQENVKQEREAREVEKYGRVLSEDERKENRRQRGEEEWKTHGRKLSGRERWEMMGGATETSVRSYSTTSRAAVPAKPVDDVGGGKDEVKAHALGEDGVKAQKAANRALNREARDHREIEAHRKVLTTIERSPNSKTAQTRQRGDEREAKEHGHVLKDHERHHLKVHRDTNRFRMLKKRQWERQDLEKHGRVLSPEERKEVHDQEKVERRTAWAMKEFGRLLGEEERVAILEEIKEKRKRE